MNHNFKYYLIYTVAYGIILLLGEAIYRWLKGGPSWSRSFAHLSAGLITLPFPWLFTSQWWVLILCVQSILVLWATRRMKFFPSHHRIAGKSTGSFFFFASVYLCFIASYFSGKKELSVIPLLLLTVSDVSAALIGRSLGKQTIRKQKPGNCTQKTLAGSSAFLISAILVLFLSFHYYMQWNLRDSIAMTLLIAVPSTIIEAVSPHGTDNLFVPLTALIIMHISLL